MVLFEAKMDPQKDTSFKMPITSPGFHQEKAPVGSIFSIDMDVEQQNQFIDKGKSRQVLSLPPSWPLFVTFSSLQVFENADREIEDGVESLRKAVQKQLNRQQRKSKEDIALVTQVFDTMGLLQALFLSPPTVSSIQTHFFTLTPFLGFPWLRRAVASSKSP